MKRTLNAQHVVTTIRRASTRRATGRAEQRSKGPQPKPKHERAKAPAAPTPPPLSQPPLPPPSSPKDKITPNQLGPSRAIPWVLGSLTAGALAFYLAALYVEATKPCNNPRIAELSEQKDVAARYDETADAFDSEVGVSEMLMGVNRLRNRLARQCHGHVLEVSCGTGRNLGYFDIGPASAVESLTFVDLSPRMVDVCKRKWNVLVGEEKEGVEKGRRGGWSAPHGIKRSLVVRFLTGSALAEMPAPPLSTSPSTDQPPQPPAREEGGRRRKYTTILQTMGLCSTPNPHALLANLARHLDTTDPEARILLLEHGRSYQGWLNRVLDNAAARHAEIHGCWFNRDVGGIVAEAAREAGLEVRRVRRHHLGTTWVMELRPGEAALREGKGAGAEEVQGGRGGGGRGWLSRG